MGGKKYFFPEGVCVAGAVPGEISNLRVAQFVNAVPGAPRYFLIKSHRNISQLGTCYTLAKRLGQDSLLFWRQNKKFYSKGNIG